MSMDVLLKMCLDTEHVRKSLLEPLTKFGFDVALIMSA
jgi:hypothetical protein